MYSKTDIPVYHPCSSAGFTIEVEVLDSMNVSWHMIMQSFELVVGGFSSVKNLKRSTFKFDQRPRHNCESDYIAMHSEKCNVLATVST